MAVYQKLDIGLVLRHYKRVEIQQALVDAADKKEIAISYGGTGYGKRPDVLMYPRDVLEMVKAGATSFHCSEELWKNPLQVTTGMRAEDLNEIRSGWDLILDIDCPELEYSKVAAHLLVQALRHHGIKNVSVKFSGNHGFHIGIASEAFPEVVNNVPVKNLFPDGPRKIAAYLQHMIKDVLAQNLLERDPAHVIAQKIKKEQKEIVKNGQLDAFAVLAIDTVLIASRHLYRMPYSLNEKSGLVSVVIAPEEILAFNKASASPEKVVPRMKFLDRAKVVPGEAKQLLVHAFDFRAVSDVSKQQQEDTKVLGGFEKKEFEPVLTAIPEQYFPPCIQKIAQGLVDGKKRALLILINFLSSCGWSYEMIESYVREWNKKNPEPLREVYVNGQLRYAKVRKKAALPPNCDNKAYMVDLGVCAPDGFCAKIRNPANYSIAKQRMMAALAEKEQKDVEKQNRAKEREAKQEAKSAKKRAEKESKAQQENAGSSTEVRDSN